MKTVYCIDQDGFYLKVVEIKDNGDTPSDCVDTFPSYGLYKPKWNGSQWIEAETPENLLTEVKASKLAELNGKCDQTIMSGFTSSALGTSHTYRSLLIDQVWFNATLNRFAVDPNFTSVNYLTLDSGYLQHTKAQLTQVFVDGHAFGDSQITKLNALKAQVDNATTIEDVENITW